VLRKKRGRLVVTKKNEVLLEIPVIKIDGVAIFGNVQVTSQTLSFLMKEGIDVNFLSQFGYFKGKVQGQFSKNLFLREEQLNKRNDSRFCLSLSKEIVHGKLVNSRTLAQKWERDGLIQERKNIDLLKQIISSVKNADNLETLRGFEGSGAKVYFEIFGRAIKSISSFFSFDGRNRRPPKDPINVLLSLGYTFLQNQVYSAINIVGLDPYWGFLHSDKYGSPSLVLDMMEEFRPVIVDRLVFRCIKSGFIKKEHFTQEGEKVLLSKEGFEIFVKTYDDFLKTSIKHPLENNNCTYFRSMEIQLRILSGVITDKIRNYTPFLIK
jgi:CRISPR-associated protein Cas1